MALIIKNSMKLSVAQSILKDMQSNQNQYFLFIANSIPWLDENAPLAYIDTDFDETTLSRNIIGYKKLNPKNIVFTIPRVNWTSGTVYDQYEYNSSLSENFYVVSNNNIYKCLSNNNRSPSIDPPAFTQSSVFNTSDNYQWKYLAAVNDSSSLSLSDLLEIEYATSSIDKINQYNTQIESVPGTIIRADLDEVDAPLLIAEYPKAIIYSPSTTGLLSTFTGLVIGAFSRVDSKTSTITITDTASIAQIDSLIANHGEYTFKDYVFRVKLNPNFPMENNNYAIIESVTTQAGVRRITVKDDFQTFSVTPSSGLQQPVFAEILPYVKIQGDGFGAVLFPTMRGTVGHYSIKSLNVSSGGRNYSHVSASVFTRPRADTIHSEITITLGPKLGHGSNIINELQCKEVLFSVVISEEDNKIILPGGSYRQYGIIKNPKLNGSVAIAGSEDLFFRDITLTNETTQTTSVFADNLIFPYVKNLLIGKESSSCVEIVKLKSYNNETKRIVYKTSGTRDDFVEYADRPFDFLLGLCASNVAFRLGEKITQFVPAGAIVYPTPSGVGVSYGFGILAEGIVVSGSTMGYTLGIRTTKNAFVSSASIGITGDKSGLTAYINSIIPKFGEYVFTAQQDQGITISSVNQLKVVESGNFYTDTSLLYSGLHRIHLNTSVSAAVGGLDTTLSALTPTTYHHNDIVEQGNTADWNSHYASGRVYAWEYKNSSYGILHLTHVNVIFYNQIDNGLSGSTLGNYIISGVSLPDISPLSGEVIYIDSVRPITRGINQKEEFRLKISF